MPNSYISKITTSQGTFYLKDSEARDLINAIAGQIQFHQATSAATTPLGVTWDNNGTTITGTLVPATSTGSGSSQVWTPTTGYYLVKQTNATGQDYYQEWVVVTKSANSGTSYGGYAWELLGDTEIDFSSLGALAYKDSVTLNKSTDHVLGAGTSITASSSAVTFSGSQIATSNRVSSVTPTTQKLETTSITGTNGTISVSQVGTASRTATNTVLGENTTASKITTSSKTATNTTFGSAANAHYVTKSDVTVPIKNTSATNVSRIALSTGNTSILETATVDTTTETLTFGTASVTQSSVTGVQSSTTTASNITDLTVVGVPQVSSNDSVTFSAVASNTDVTVPVISSNDSVTAHYVTVTNVNAAKAASSATIVATGQTVASDTNGDDVVTGVSTDSGAVVTGITGGTAAAQTITVGNNDDVIALTDSTSITVS